MHDVIKAALGIVDGRVVHFIHTHDHLFHTHSERQQSVLTGLAISRNASLKLAGSGSDDEKSNIGMGGSSDHVLDEISVPRSINDGVAELWGVKVADCDIDSNTTISLGLENQGSKRTWKR